jgi:predicted nucleic acid-binding protein
LTAGEVEELLRRLTSLDLRRLPITGALLDAAWRMRDDIAARDALYVAAARGLGDRNPIRGVLTLDGPAAKAPVL